jgi:LPXTG-motif cell wall-anchored protein
MDISLTSVSGIAIHQLNGYVSVTLPIPEGLSVSDGKTILVYRLEDDGSLTKCNSTVSNGTITFQTNHFSTYIFVEYSAGVSPDTSDANSSILLMALLLLVCGAAVIWTSRKKLFA